MNKCPGCDNVVPYAYSCVHYNSKMRITYYLTALHQPSTAVSVDDNDQAVVLKGFIPMNRIEKLLVLG